MCSALLTPLYYSDLVFINNTCRPGNFLCWLLKGQSEICQWSALPHHPQPIKLKYCSLCTISLSCPLTPSVQSVTAPTQSEIKQYPGSYGKLTGLLSWALQHVRVLIVSLMYISCCFYTRLLSTGNLSLEELLKYYCEVRAVRICHCTGKLHLVKTENTKQTYKATKVIWLSEQSGAWFDMWHSTKRDYSSVSFSEWLNTAFESLLRDKSSRLWGALMACFQSDAYRSKLLLTSLYAVKARQQ